MKLGRLIFPEVVVDIVPILNVELLLKNYDSEFLRLILGCIERWDEEVEDGGVRTEVENVRKRLKM